jgi:hypothetical protein
MVKDIFALDLFTHSDCFAGNKEFFFYVFSSFHRSILLSPLNDYFALHSFIEPTLLVRNKCFYFGLFVFT